MLAKITKCVDLLHQKNLFPSLTEQTEEIRGHKTKKRRVILPLRFF